MRQQTTHWVSVVSTALLAILIALFALLRSRTSHEEQPGHNATEAHEPAHNHTH